MKRFLLVAVLTVAVLSLTACGSPGLTKVEAGAIAGVEKQAAGFGISNPQQPVVIGEIAKDSAGNHATFVDVTASAGSQKVDMVIIVVTRPNGSLLFADVLLPSGAVTVTP